VTEAAPSGSAGISHESGAGAVVAGAGAGDYEYRGLMATSWDVFRAAASGWPDVAFYRDVILASGQPALDVGCATGRLVLGYLAEGMDVDGVDVSPEMLALCREKANRGRLNLTLYQQAVQSLDLPRTYRTIVVSSSTFQLLTDPSDAAEAMRRFYHHLDPGGTLVMSLMLLWTGGAPDGTAGSIVREDWRGPRERERQEDGTLVRRWTRSTYDLAQQLEHTEDRYEVVRDGRIVAAEHHSRSPATRWYTPEQSVALYRAAGFVDVHLVHEFTREPIRPDSTLWCALGARP
jgi:SAM-dependent methyltransferase